MRWSCGKFKEMNDCPLLGWQGSASAWRKKGHMASSATTGFCMGLLLQPKWPEFKYLSYSFGGWQKQMTSLPQLDWQKVNVLVSRAAWGDNTTVEVFSSTAAAATAALLHRTVQRIQAGKTPEHAPFAQSKFTWLTIHGYILLSWVNDCWSYDRRDCSIFPIVGKAPE